MTRRDLLRLGAIGTGVFAIGGLTRLGGRAVAQSPSVPTVDRLVMTNVVDNVYDVFAKAGKLDSVTVERTGLRIGADSLLAEHGLAYHLESVRGMERRQILLDFSLTERNLLNNYKVLKVDPAAADALVISHGHADHYGALPDYARLVQGKTKPGLTLFAGGEDTFCHRVVATPSGTIDQGQLDRAGLES
jgi:7,8-dihydropterin-6-yl-methyl-4-(beta-D-ribofuranosyl)aminobenzene 5'-phosphate synthase